MKKATITKLIEKLRKHKIHLVTAESLTCGGISKELTSVSGASDVINGGFSVYQDEMKSSLLGVSVDVLKNFTAVSDLVALQMAVGALKKTDKEALGEDKASNIAIAVTGYASSPRGAAEESKKGLVYIAIATQFNKKADVNVYRHVFTGSRNSVRQKTTDTAINYVIELVNKL